MTRFVAEARARLMAGAGTAEDLAWARQRVRALEDMGGQVGISEAEFEELANLIEALARADA